MNNSNRRISLVVPQPTGGHGQTQPQNLSADGRKKNTTDKKKKNPGKIVHESASSNERIAHHKFSSSGYAGNFTINQVCLTSSSSQLHQEPPSSKKKKSSKSRISHQNQQLENGNNVTIVNQKGISKGTPSHNNHIYSQDQSSCTNMRTQTLSPPPANKEKNNVLQNIVLSKSNSKNGNSSLQRSTKRINYLKSLVKKQQQKSLSRDFTNAIMNTNIVQQKPSQFQLFKSHNSSGNQNNNICLTQNSTSYNQNMTQPHTSLSPNSRQGMIGNSSHKKKKKLTSKKKKDENVLTHSVQLFKPPINKTAQNLLMQTSLNLKAGGLSAMLNDSKESSYVRANTSHHNQGINHSLMTICNQPTMQTINLNQNVSITRQPGQSQKRKQQRSNTQERVLRIAEQQLKQLNNELDFTNKKHIMPQSQANHSQVQIQADQTKLKQLIHNSNAAQCQIEYMNKENNKNVQMGHSKTSQIIGPSCVRNDSLFQLDRTFTDIIESIQQQASSGDSTQIQQRKQQANLTLIKSQLELIKNSYESIIKKLSDSQLAANIQALSARQNPQRLLSDRQNEDENTTHATTSQNDCFSASSSFRTQQSQACIALMQQKITDLENQNKTLNQQVLQKNDTIQHQEQIISLLKQEVKKDDASTQANFEMAVQTPKITERKTELLIENEQLKIMNDRIQKKLNRMQTKLDYHKNKENKFLYFLYSLQNSGIPVNEIYEKEGIKDIPTSRFADIVGDEQVNQSSMMFSFYSDDSYDPIDVGPDPAQIRKKPKTVPALNLNNLPDYESSSDEEDNQDSQQKQTIDYASAQINRNMTTQDYEQSMKYIENFYNKCGGTQGIPMKNLESDDEDHREDYVMCQINNGSSILLFEKEESQSNVPPSHLNPGSLMDDDFCYSVDKQSKRRSSKDMRSI
ncbi:UNKNOWN [Stylonychia lemnae]|uniref:Uncharacterized protein n=1 Tax=Stylonychia lemnae TaxID=5949 RepID=A0A078BCC4_STYLE|nr:UNKNOWN [Stylonychia lemnae]|eukprot:CDW91253.1 UNKNOWN [Stylonychia lemnae]